MTESDKSDDVMLVSSPSRRKSAWRVAWATVRVLFLCYLGLAIMFASLQCNMMYHPTAELEASPADIGLAYENVSLKTADGVLLHAWFIPAEPSRGTVLFFHGNGGNISHRITTINLFHGLGFDVLIVDYRGYGQSEGSPDEEGTYRDAEAAWAYLTEQRGIAPDKIVLFGRSLGGAIAAYLATQHTCAAVILESTFTSVPDLAGDLYPLLRIFPLRWMLIYDYNTLKRIETIHVPILVVHSPDDDLIPFRHGERIYAAAREPKQFVQIEGGHNDGHVISKTVYTDGLKKFLDAHFQSQP